ncbi:MAG: hypothetical protein EG823_03795 [Actinobacteria bacterium]|nr:hypothetical protein [Actinomycetota bacterium]
MANRLSERPEGERTSSRAQTAWRIVREVFSLLAVWIIALYVISQSRGSVTNAAIAISIGCFTALLLGLGLEAIVMGKTPTMWLGCLVLAAWGAVLPFAPPGPYLAAIGIAGLALIAVTPREWRRRSLENERDFLREHPRWAIWRHGVRRLLVAGMVIGLVIAVLTGIWNSVAVI